MKRNSSDSAFFNPRIFAAFVLCSMGAWLAMFSFAATSPASGTLTSANIGSSNAINYTDSVGSAVPNLTFFAGNGTCAAPMSCSTFTLTIDSSVGTPSTGYDPTQYQIFIEVSWAQASEDYDTWMCSGAGNCTQANVVASNTSTAEPETIVLPTSQTPGVYTINLVNTSGAAEPYNGTIYLKKIPTITGCTGNCTPPRYFNYPAGVGQAEPSGEPSIGVDWNPNVASLKDVSSSDFTTGTKRLNTGGVVFYKGGTGAAPIGDGNWRVNFDDCSSPAVNVWEDVSATFDQQFVLTDPIGFVDHYSSSPLGTSYPPPLTPGRVFTLDLIGGQGNSQGAFSDNDGNSYSPGANGGPGQGPDHETLGGGPYNPNSTPPPPPQPIAYGSAASPNAIYYCSQNIAAEAECSRSDDGGQTFGPGVPIYNPTVCTGGIHGHVKVAPDGTVYVPNSSCGENGGTTGVAVSTDNGLTWTERNVAGSGSTQDPSVGIGQNNVGQPSGQTTNTIYLGYVDNDGHPKVAYSGDRGSTWSTPIDVGKDFGVTHGVFPVVVAGDDDRAAFGFLGTGDAITDPSVGGSCDPYGSTVNCENIWHLYVATTYDGGANWITVDATPNDPVQKGVICLQGTTCPSPPVAPNTRNLLDFNDFSVDAEGRGVVGYDDGCVNCDNDYSHGGQSGDSHGTVARQSGGRRLFAAFDPVEPAAPAAPQLISVVLQGSGGALLSWLEPDNGGSPITGYNIYRSTSSGTEVKIATVTGETNTKYLDTAVPVAPNVFYYATAVNAIDEGTHCGEVSLLGVTQNGNSCTAPYIKVNGPGIFKNNLVADPTGGEATIQYVSIGEPFTSCTDKSITFTMKVQTLDPAGSGMAVLSENTTWEIVFSLTDDSGNPEKMFVSMDTIVSNGASPTNPEFNWGREDLLTMSTQNSDTTECTQGGVSTCPTISGSFTKDGLITIKLLYSAAPGGTFVVPAPGTGTTGSAFNWTPRAGDILSAVNSDTAVFAGAVIGANAFVQQSTAAPPGGSTSYTMKGNVSCHQLAPIAVLGATPRSGPSPLAVSFDGTGSHPQAGACGVINSYTLNFGDGSAAVTNSTGMFNHTYNAPGDYPATLTVADSLGLVSTNPAQVIITVGGNPPPLSSVVSVKTHGSAGTFGVPLQKDAITQPRGVECRSGGTSGNFSIVFTFQNNLTGAIGTDPGAASVVLGPGSVVAAGTGIGPLQNQYTVNLTGVTNRNYVTVALHNVADIAGNVGDEATTMGVLLGDVNATGAVDGNDVSSVQSHTRQPVTQATCRFDVNVTGGTIDGNDVSLTQSSTRTSLPSAP